METSQVESKDSNPPINNEGHEKKSGDGNLVDVTTTTTVNAEVSLETRIVQLKASIKEAKEAFKTKSKNISTQVWVWAVISFLLIVGGILFSIYLLNPNNIHLDKAWTWQVIYYTVIRVTLIAAIFSLATYCFKLLSAHLQMYHYNEHKRAVIEALPGFVESGMDPQKRDIIFNKLVELVIKYDDISISSKENDLKTSNDLVLRLIELLLKKEK